MPADLRTMIVDDERLAVERLQLLCARLPGVDMVATASDGAAALRLIPVQPRPGREDDAVDPPQAYPASKVAAEKELRESDLTWAVLRFPFVQGDGDGKPRCAGRTAQLLR